MPDVPVVIPEHPLFAGQGGSGARPVVECPAAPLVLDRVVIPKTITVHLGKPSASARNVTVSFRDYIANVASSEVYPTWPEQALRANIHCQISGAQPHLYRVVSQQGVQLQHHQLHQLRPVLCPWPHRV